MILDTYIFFTNLWYTWSSNFSRTRYTPDLKNLQKQVDNYALLIKFRNSNSLSWKNDDGQFYRSSWSCSAHRRSRRSPLLRACTILLYCPNVKKNIYINISKAHKDVNTVNVYTTKCNKADACFLRKVILQYSQALHIPPSAWCEQFVFTHYLYYKSSWLSLVICIQIDGYIACKLTLEL